LNEEFDAEEDGPAKFVLNIASQEYAKAVELSALRAPVITVQFPGPSVHAKTARGEMARFCATEAVCCAEQLKGFRWTGRQLGGDLNKIGRDCTYLNAAGCSVSCMELIDLMRERSTHIIELGRFAARRKVVPSGTADLEKIAFLTLGKSLSKDPVVRLSKWSAATLLPEQITYAALDAIVGIDVYFHLAAMPDLVQRLPAAEAMVGCMADLVPSHGSVNVMGTRAAVCSIVACTGSWSNTIIGSTPSSYNISSTRRLVEVQKVCAPAYDAAIRMHHLSSHWTNCWWLPQF